MRRRQAYHVPEQTWPSTNTGRPVVQSGPAVAATWPDPVALQKGHCPKCGKHIGKGIAGHKKACKG